MRSLRIPVAAALPLLALLAPAPADAQPYSAEDLGFALEQGLRGDADRLQDSCDASVGGFWNKLNEALQSTQGADGSYHGVRRFRITGQPPLARVAWHAEQSKKQYRPMPLPDDEAVLDMVRDDIFTVWANPDTGGSMITAARLADTGVEHLVLRPRGDKDGRQAIQPIFIELAGEQTARNLFGATVELEGVVASFDSQEVIEIAKEADVEAVLITSAGEFKCNLDDNRILRGYREK